MTSQKAKMTSILRQMEYASPNQHSLHIHLRQRSFAI